MILRKQSSLDWQVTRHNPKVLKQVYLSPHELPALYQCARARIPANQYVAEHTHESANETFLVVKGRPEFHVSGQITDLEPGDCIVVQAGEPHAIYNNSESEVELIFFLQPHIPFQSDGE